MHIYPRILSVAIMMLAVGGCVPQNKHLPADNSPTAVRERDERAAIEKWRAMDIKKNPILPDERLITTFQNHRATFEQLLRMVTADSKLHRVDEDWTDPGDPKAVGVSPGRIKEYRHLLQKVGCRRGFCAYPGRPGIYFISASQGTVVASIDKGYYYFEGTPVPVVTNTATYYPKDQTYSYEVFRHIDGHWYVYYQESD